MSAVVSKAAKGTKKGGSASKSSASSSFSSLTPAKARAMPAYALGQEAAPAMSLFGGTLQAKLSVSQPDDPAEHQADAVADTVANGSPAPELSRLDDSQTMHRAAAEEEEKKPEEEATEEGGDLLQRAAEEEQEEEPAAAEETPEQEKQEFQEEQTPVQTKLVVGRAGDTYEQEADSVAQHVASSQNVSAISAISPGGQSGMAQSLLQQQPADEEEEEEPADEQSQSPSVQRQAEEEERDEEEEEPAETAVQPLLVQRQDADEPEAPPPDEDEPPEDELAQPLLLQRQAADGAAVVQRAAGKSCGCQGSCSCGASDGAAAGQSSATEAGEGHAAPAVVQASGGSGGGDTKAVSNAIHQRGSGSPLDEGVQQAIESHTGYDMSGVRVHQDNSAQSAARSLHARAFTHGSDIWLGPGESASDVRLMAHEATHVVQQNSGSGDIRRIQRKPSDYQHPEDGGAVGGRLDSRFDEIDEDDRPDEEPEVDRGELRQESSGLRGETRPDVDRPAQEQPKVEQSAEAVEREAETPPDPLVEGEPTQEPQGEGGEGEATGAAEQAAALAQQAMAAADSQTEPAPETEVRPPEPVTPVDSAGEPLEADPEAESALASLADRAQFLREQGTLMRAQASEGRSNAEIMRANLAKVTGEIGEAESGITRSQDHASYRREVVGQAEQALGVSEEKQATVAAQAPEYTAKADEGKEETGPMSSEAGELAAENNSNIPEDEDAAGDAREQGAQINQVGEQSVTMDSAVSQTRTRAESLGQDAARAAELNTQTQGTIGDSQQQLDTVDARLAEHSSQAAAARAQVEGMAASQPADLHARASQLDETGQALIASSFELESRLHDTQQRYAAGTAAVPAVEEWDGEMPAEESGAEGGEEGVIQLTPDDSAPRPATPDGGGGGTTTTTPPPTTPAPTPAPSPSASSSAASAAPAPPDIDQAAEPDAEVEEPTTAGEEEAPAEEEGEPAAEGGEEATGGGAEDTGEAAGEAEEAVPETEELQPREREPIDLNQRLPGWLTGIEPQSEERREQAAQEQEDQRRAEIDSINAMAHGRPISQLGAGERVGIALRVVGSRYYNAVSNVQWPGWGGLARMLLDPRTMLTGAVGGLNMILNAGANLFSAERWRQDPLGNLLQSSADIATGLAIILGSITALAGLVAAVMGALILVTFGFAAPIALPVIGVCTTIITTVGGWTIAVGKIALVLQALALIKNLIDAATAQTAQDLQREAGQIQSNINGAAVAAMSIVGAKGSQAGLSRLRGRAAGVIRASRRAGGARALARQTFGRGVSAVGRGTRAVGRGVVGGARAVGRGARAVGRGVVGGARAVGRGMARGARAVGRGVAAAGRGVGRGLRGLRNRLRRRLGRTRTDPAALVGRTSGLRIGGRSHTLSFRRIGNQIRVWLCSGCGDFLAQVEDIFNQLGGPRGSGAVFRRVRVLRRQAARLNRDIRTGRLTEAQGQAQLDRLARRLEGLARRYPGERAFGAARLSWGTNFIIKVKKHSQQMREIARGHGFTIPTSPANPATVGVMQRYIQHIVRAGETRFGRYMTIPDAIWTKLDNGIIIRRANGEFLTFLDYSLGGQALHWDRLPIR